MTDLTISPIMATTNAIIDAIIDTTINTMMTKKIKLMASLYQTSPSQSQRISILKTSIKKKQKKLILVTKKWNKMTAIISMRMRTRRTTLKFKKLTSIEVFKNYGLRRVLFLRLDQEQEVMVKEANMVMIKITPWTSIKPNLITHTMVTGLATIIPNLITTPCSISLSMAI